MGVRWGGRWEWWGVPVVLFCFLLLFSGFVCFYNHVSFFVALSIRFLAFNVTVFQSARAIYRSTDVPYVKSTSIPIPSHVLAASPLS